jgi:hypothetical protein
MAHPINNKYSMKELDENKIRFMHANNFSASEISTEMNVDVGTVYNRLKKLGIYTKRHRKYILNEKYFENIDSENKAYWLGFLMADGYNSGKFIRVDIQDIGHLEKFRDDIYPNKDMPVRTKISPTNKCVYYLTIQDSKFVKDCEKLGVLNKKSHIAKYPNIDKEMDKHFIRGLFDGDGCLSYSMDGKYRRYNFSIVGSKDIISEVRNKLLLIGVNIGFRKTKSIYELHIRGNRQIIKVLNWLYVDSSTFLERKFRKYDDMITWDGFKRDKKLNKLLTIKTEDSPKER